MFCAIISCPQNYTKLCIYLETLMQLCLLGSLLCSQVICHNRAQREYNISENTAALLMCVMQMHLSRSQWAYFTIHPPSGGSLACSPIWSWAANEELTHSSSATHTQVQINGEAIVSHRSDGTQLMHEVCVFSDSFLLFPTKTLSANNEMLISLIMHLYCDTIGTLCAICRSGAN